MSWIGLSLVTITFWGITGVTQKLATRTLSSGQAFVWFAMAFAPVSLAIAVFSPAHAATDARGVAQAALGGLLNGGGALASFAALARGGKASVVIPVISLYPLITLAGGLLFLGESVSARQGLGIVCAMVAAALLSRET